ncbi:short-chain dehydrogenase [Xylariaceae sp. FL1272]|nr:short-chain dehydrogenase [Xylariaceae sp. FL1272]
MNTDVKHRDMTSPVFKLPGVALVTGAAGIGIGAAVAKGFVQSGCLEIMITDIKDLTSTRTALLQINPDVRVTLLQGDIAKESFAQHLAEKAVRKYGRIDYFVNCASVLGQPLRSHALPINEFDRITSINYKASWLMSRAALATMIKQDPLPHPKQRGAIVNVTGHSLAERPTTTPYCGSRAAIIEMTKADAVDYSRENIRVNCVCPGTISTDTTTHSLALDERTGTLDEVADAVLFLCSEQASFIQGHALVVDGGFTADRV